MSTHARAAGVRVVVCDDSPFMRRFLAGALRTGPIELVGEAGDGEEALAACARLRPDVLTLDMHMPGLSGLDVLRRLPPDGPRVVVVSAHTAEGSDLALDALELGATEVLSKPGLKTSHDDFAAALQHTVTAAAAARRPVRRPHLQAAPPAGAPGPAAAAGTPLVVIACSTGGPQALARVVPALPANLGCGVLIVQHMPAGFTASLARRLDAASAISVREARDGDRIERGVALLAPGDHHLRVELGRVRLSRDAAVGGLRPRADITLEDAASAYRGRVLAVVLTGMGEDGLRGVRAVKAAGGRCVAEAEGTCVVYGMPRAVAEAGLVDAVRPLEAVSRAVQELAA